ncbi:putative oxalocrotonate tautomerase [Gautieria morchelliformis]|nr:putative oxalocrotonate tautomerase [Gautieria morchelliformis]
MPLHCIYATPGTFSVEDKVAIAERITTYYTSPPVNLPAFYVNVFFIDVPEDSFYIGGKPRKNFVRIVSQQLARSGTKDNWSKNLDGLEACWAPFIKDRGLDWEMHIEQHERGLWRVQGQVPPLPGTAEERMWVQENRAVPYE